MGLKLSFNPKKDDAFMKPLGNIKENPLDPWDLSGADAAKKAAQAQADAARRAADISAESQLELWREGQKATAPWREAGAESLTMLQDIYGGDRSGAIDRFRASEGYQQRMADQELAAREAMERSGRDDPALYQVLMCSVVGYVDSVFVYYVIRLEAMSGVGQSYASQTASGAYGLGQNIGQGYQTAATQAGQAQAQGVINQANQRANLMNQGASMLGSYFGAKPMSRNMGTQFMSNTSPSSMPSMDMNMPAYGAGHNYSGAV